jgi:hypothetical protein
VISNEIKFLMTKLLEVSSSKDPFLPVILRIRASFPWSEAEHPKRQRRGEGEHPKGAGERERGDNFNTHLLFYNKP